MLISFFVIRDATMENELRKEVKYLSKLDVTKDRYNRKIKTSGKYAIVEKAIKEYLDDYAVSLQNVLSIINDEELTTILSYDNYTSDGPEFTKSREYLESTKNEFNDEIDDLINKLSEDEIKAYIKTKTDDEYYIDLYNELMLSSKMSSDYNETLELLKSSKTRVNNVFDTSSEVLNFLALYKDSWVVEDGQIKFQTTELYNYYNSLISKVTVKDSE